MNKCEFNTAGGSEIMSIVQESDSPFRRLYTFILASKKVTNSFFLRASRLSSFSSSGWDGTDAPQPYRSHMEEPHNQSHEVLYVSIPSSF